MVKVGIVGVTGFAGEKLLEILLGHSEVKVCNLSAKIEQEKDIGEIFPKFKNRLELPCYPVEKASDKIGSNCDLVFLALPHTVSMQMVPTLLKKGKKVIDLSADYRLKDVSVYEKFYVHQHQDKANLSTAVYGLPELYRQKIKGATLIANPGCYPTAAILALAPLFSCAVEEIDPKTIIIDAKSGVSGAGRKLLEGLLFVEVNEDFKAYKVNSHQHTPEIDQELSKLADKKIKTIFVPHLLPINQGILETIYLKKIKSRGRIKGLHKLYSNFYKTEPFVRIRKEGDFPRIKDVLNTNYCDIGICESEEYVIIISAIDNLVKGASGQAVQNMNIMLGYPEQMGLQ